jgi:hypothetical protein
LYDKASENKTKKEKEPRVVYGDNKLCDLMT